MIHEGKTEHAEQKMMQGGRKPYLSCCTALGSSAAGMLASGLELLLVARSSLQKVRPDVRGSCSRLVQQLWFACARCIIVYTYL